MNKFFESMETSLCFLPSIQTSTVNSGESSPLPRSIAQTAISEIGTRITPTRPLDTPKTSCASVEIGPGNEIAQNMSQPLRGRAAQ